MLVMMTIVAMMLGIIFGMLYFSTSSNIERESIQMMRTIAMTPGLMKLHDDQMESVRLPYITVQVNRDGEVVEIREVFFDKPDEELMHTLLQMVYKTNDETGVLKQYGLRFLRLEKPMGENIVFADMSTERSILRNQIKTLVGVGIMAFLAFGIICILLAYWVVKPVEKAWKQQKQFIADASHELKTPLTVIMTDAEILNDPTCPEKEREQISGSIITMSEQMSGLVESMLDNAGKYASPGGRCDSSSEKRQYKRCLLTVSNQGEQISNDEIKHLFERFYRADKARTRNRSYGLGLSIA